MADRVREADYDLKDRNKEQEELEELKTKIFNGEYDNPSREFERVSFFLKLMFCYRIISCYH